MASDTIFAASRRTANKATRVICVIRQGHRVAVTARCIYQGERKSYCRASVKLRMCAVNHSIDPRTLIDFSLSHKCSVLVRSFSCRLSQREPLAI
jgi:hypothetical protein